MCGIFGILNKTEFVERELIYKANQLLSHRGPDDEGYVFINVQNCQHQLCSGADSIPSIKALHPHILSVDSTNFDLAFTHRRLSIIDLSENGHQPMCDASQKIWITFNGEIYNYIEIKRELESNGYVLGTKSDTEVIIYSYLHWGEDCVKHFNGMWAFAIWDSSHSKLFLSRDRFGVKPLYFVNNSSFFAFASEVKPLLVLSHGLIEIDTNKLKKFFAEGLRLNDEKNIIKNIYTLEPSHSIIYSNNQIVKRRYYQIPYFEHEHRNFKEYENHLLELLTDSIKLRMRSDVSVGSCLSGGFDSSSIVLIASKMTNHPMNTFSAVWEDKKIDESKYIDCVTRESNTINFKITSRPEELFEIIDKIIWHQEVPTEGPGLIPQWKVMELAHQNKIKVLLDGQGGDEVFGGYFTLVDYLNGVKQDSGDLKLLTHLPSIVYAVNLYGPHKVFRNLYPIVYRHLRNAKSTFMKKSFLGEPLALVFESDKVFSPHYLNNILYKLLTKITIPSLLHYEDRSSMAFSVESRTPFLDYRLVEFGINLPLHLLFSKNKPRYLFRSTLKDLLPTKIYNRKDKKGYPTPFDSWIRKELRVIVKNMLLDSRIILEHNLNINSGQIEYLLNQHFKRTKDYSWQIWRLLNIVLWFNMFSSGFKAKITE